MAACTKPSYPPARKDQRASHPRCALPFHDPLPPAPTPAAGGEAISVPQSLLSFSVFLSICPNCYTTPNKRKSKTQKQKTCTPSSLSS